MKRIGLAILLALLLVLPARNDVGASVGIDSGTNAFRAQHGLHALATDARLANLAAHRAREIVKPDFSHNIPVLVDRISAVFSCWHLVGENIAYRTSPTSDATFVQLWEASPEHRDNMLNPAFTLQGSATYVAPDGLTYAVQLFVAGCASAPTTPAPVRTAAPKPAPAPTRQPATKPAPAHKTPSPTFALPDTSTG